MKTYFNATGLRKSKGMRGYGVYVRLIELCNESADGFIAFDYETLAWDMRERADFVKSVVEDYGLFAISNRGFYPVERTQPHDASSQASEQAQTPAQESPEVKEEKNEVAVEVVEEESDDNSDNIDKPNPYEILRDKWNALFTGTHRVVNNLFPSPATANDLQVTLKEFSIEDITKAFAEARDDTSWTWQLEHVLRSKNIKMLLSRIEQREEAKRKKEKEEYENMTPGQKEAYEYCVAHGLPWRYKNV